MCTCGMRGVARRGSGVRRVTVLEPMGMLTQQRVVADPEPALAGIRRGPNFAHREDHGWRT
jgi:hypothetical protein